jgi:glycoprotein endo-alpha-1,2-mannosidase
VRIALTALGAAAAIVLAVPAAMPAAPREQRWAAAFFYGWWGTRAHDGTFRHWQQDGHRPPADIASSFYPKRGAYSSADVRVLDDQMAEIAHAGIDEAVISWWGRGSWEDAHLRSVVAAARRHGVKPAAHLEPYPGRTAATVADDLAYLKARGIRDVFVYEPDLLAASAWASVRARTRGVRLFAETGKVGWAAAARFDGVYTYDILAFDGSRFARFCAQAHQHRLLCAPSVGPGYDAERAGPDRRVKPRADGLTYDAMWLAALHAGADAVTITSFNEWHEGTQLEPARPQPRYADYSGAWGVRGAAAACAYLWRTAQWTHALARGRSVFLRPLKRQRWC